MQSFPEISKVPQGEPDDYHDMAKGKAQQIGKNYGLKEVRTIEEARKKEIYQKVAELGCRDLEES